MSGVLIVGSYPPIPRPAAAVALAQVREAWAEGAEVTVVSPRLSAAHLTVEVHGLLAGRRLDNVRRHTTTTRLVLVIEEGYPFSSRSAPVQRATAEVLARAMARFDSVRLVRVADPRVDPAAMTRLQAAATEVVSVPGASPPPGATVFGPAEVTAKERPRQLLSIAARRVLGPRAPQVRAYLGKMRRLLASVSR